MKKLLIGTAAIVATSTFVTGQVDASTQSEAEKSVVAAEKLAGSLKKAITFEYGADGRTAPIDLHKQTKETYNKAKTLVEKTTGTQREVLRKRLEQNVYTQIRRAEAYITAVESGKLMISHVQKLTSEIKNNRLNAETEKLYGQVTLDIQKQRELVGKVYGFPTKHRLNKIYTDYVVLAKSNVDKQFNKTTKVTATSIKQAEPTLIGPSKGTQVINGNLEIIAGKDKFIELRNIKVNGNVYIKGDKTGAGAVTLNNVSSNSFLKKGGTIVVENVADHSLYLTKTVAKQLSIKDADGSHVAANTGTAIGSVNVTSGAAKSGAIVLDSKVSGVFGSVAVNTSGNGGVTFKGDFSQTEIQNSGTNAFLKMAADAVAQSVKLTAGATVEAEKDAKLNILDIAVGSQGEDVILKGDLSTTSVQISNANAKVSVSEGAVVKEITIDESVTTPVEIDNQGEVQTSKEVVQPQDFGVFINETAGVRGYSVGFKLVNKTAADFDSVSVSLYKGDKLLQTNTSKQLLSEYPTATELSSPFDVDGSFSDTSWTYGEWKGAATDIATRAVITVKAKDGRIYSVDNSNLTGDTTLLQPITGEAAKSFVQPQDFGVNMNDTAGIRGYNVGFKLMNGTAKDLHSVEVSLYKGDTLLQKNTSKGLLTEYPDAAELSSPFDVDGSFSDTSWTYGKWNGTVTDVPSKAVIKVTAKDGHVYIVENESVSGNVEELKAPITGETAKSFVQPQDFGVNVNDAAGIRGYSVGFKLMNGTAKDLNSLEVSLYKGDTLLQKNSRKGLLTEYPNAAELSSPFDVDGSYSDTSWTYGEWNGSESDVPTHAVIKAIDKFGFVYMVENQSLTGDASILQPITGDAAETFVQPQDFGVFVNEAAGIRGYNVGFKLMQGSAKDVSSISVSLYKGETLLQTNTNKDLLKEYPDAAELSSPFDMDGTFSDTSWNYGKWNGSTSEAPNRAVIKVNAKDGHIYLVENAILTGDTTTVTSPVAAVNAVTLTNNSVVADQMLDEGNQFKLTFNEVIENSAGEAVLALQKALAGTAFANKVDVASAAGTNKDSKAFVLTVKSGSSVDLKASNVITVKANEISDLEGMKNFDNLTFTVDK